MIFDGTNWVLFNMGNPTGNVYILLDRTNYGKIYDLLGREVIEMNIGQIYIRNNKKYIRTK